MEKDYSISDRIKRPSSFENLELKIHSSVDSKFKPVNIKWLIENKIIDSSDKRKMIVDYIESNRQKIEKHFKTTGETVVYISKRDSGLTKSLEIFSDEKGNIKDVIIHLGAEKQPKSRAERRANARSKVKSAKKVGEGSFKVSKLGVRLGLRGSPQYWSLSLH